jgi:hypothetical protein
VPDKYLLFRHEERRYQRRRKKIEWKTWYFVFVKEPPNQLTWWQRLFVGKSFSHVFAFSQVGPCVQILESTSYALEVMLWHHPDGMHLSLGADAVAAQFSVLGDTVLKIHYPVSRLKTVFSLANFSPGCVNISKNLLGIDDWVFTPNQFCQWLLENGAELYHDEKINQILDELAGYPLSVMAREQIKVAWKEGNIMGGGGRAKAQQRAQQKASERAAQQLEQDRAQAQQSLLLQQQQIEESRRREQADADKIKAENQRQADLMKRQALGNYSLIGTSELGVQDSLGG